MKYKATGQTLNTKQCTKCTATMILSAQLWRCSACQHQETAAPSKLAEMYGEDLELWRDNKCKTEQKKS